MKKFFLVLLILGIVIGLYYAFTIQKTPFVSPISLQKSKVLPLEVYTFENLKKTRFQKTNITLGNIISETDNSIAQMIYFNAPKKPNDTPSLKVSGVINIPKDNGTYPVIVMFRGFIPEESYVPGAGTQHSAEVFAKNRYITIAPDFLGFGESDKPSKDGFEARFQTNTTAITLLSSLSNLNSALDASYSGKLKANTEKIGVWGHSNGGQIALSVLEITGVAYPTVLWAPVSKSFPYSILYYTDEFDDQGRSLRLALSLFEKDYDVSLFTQTSYLSWIKAPIEIHQGTIDQEVPVWWSDELNTLLLKEKVDVTYITYPGADHNMLPSGWNSAVSNSIRFYNKYFQ